MEELEQYTSEVRAYLQEPNPVPEPGRRRRDRIVLSLWPKHSLLEGRRIDPDDKLKCPNPTMLNLEIGDAEFLVSEWSRMPNLFEQEAARSVEAALREWREAICEEDMSNAED